jgi:hypothetical protein
MAYVFVSYSHIDSEYAHKLADELRKELIEAWIDDRIDYGSKWPHVIQENLDNCSAFIVIMTPRAYESEWVQNELSRAQRKGKPIFPLLLEGDNWLSVEARQFVDVRNGNLPPIDFYERLKKFVPQQYNTKSGRLPQKSKDSTVSLPKPSPSSKTQLAPQDNILSAKEPIIGALATIIMFLLVGLAINYVVVSLAIGLLFSPIGFLVGRSMKRLGTTLGAKYGFIIGAAIAVLICITSPQPQETAVNLISRTYVTVILFSIPSWFLGRLISKFF